MKRIVLSGGIEGVCLAESDASSPVGDGARALVAARFRRRGRVVKSGPTGGHLTDNGAMNNASLVSRVIRSGEEPAGPPEWAHSTPEARMSAVWQLTLQCLAWRGAGEPRLQRSVVRIQRAPR
jgi:hypothetical protein